MNSDAEVLVILLAVCRPENTVLKNSHTTKSKTQDTTHKETTDGWQLSGIIATRATGRETDVAYLVYL